MSEDRLGQQVLVLTDRPEDYGADMQRLGLTAQYAPSAAHLLGHLLDHPASGFVLEVDKVMRAPRPERSHIFQLAGVFPVLRVLRKGRQGGLAYLDDPDHFFSRVQGFPAREVRHCGRVPVALRGLLAAAADEAFASPVRANILDLSDGGGFVSSLGDFGFEENVRLCIEDIEDRTPILSRIRWRKAAGKARARHCIGLRFLNIQPGQSRELLARFLAPQAGPGAAQDEAPGA